ncbi:MAG: AraC family transcriptional regulator [Sphingomonadaceae bacterium]|nr:AraC family transcriptional regulator [Sphingomonadaceae bacterium]
MGRAMIEVMYEAPDDRLAELVSSFYRLDFIGDRFAELERADRAQFRFQLEGSGEYHFADGHVSPTYPVTIIGPTSAPMTAKADCALSVFGWGMHSAGWAALMGDEGAAYIDRAFDARQIFGDWIMRVRNELIAAAEFADQIEIGCLAAENIFRFKASAPFKFTSKVDAWLAGDSDPDVDVLAGVTGLSQRQLERMTKRHYGMPPKKLARKYRALRAAQLLAHGDSLDDTGLGLAFYDQSHLIREVKQFTGLTPGQLRAGESELTRATMDGRRALGSKVSRLISES